MQNKLISVIMAICILCSMYYLARTAVIYTMQQEKRGEQPVIVLDAGHGGEDPGKIGINGALEKDVNLQITMRLARLLQQNGYHVILTRNEDKGLYTGNQVSKKVEDLKKALAGDDNEMIKKAADKGVKLLLPVDVVVADKFAADAESKVVAADAIPAGWMGLDIGPETQKLFGEAVKTAGTVIWNGPMGVFEFPAFAVGTKAVAEALSKTSAITIIGGGDSAAAVEQLGYADKMTHISTGGGASLEFMEGKELPGVACLLDK